MGEVGEILKMFGVGEDEEDSDDEGGIVKAEQTFYFSVIEPISVRTIMQVSSP